MSKMFSIQDWCGYRLQISNPDASVSIADLAQFVEFCPASAREKGAAEHAAAYDALCAEYGWEKVDGSEDFYDGFWVEFRDGSKIQYFN